jgi:hypothetical protein
MIRTFISQEVAADYAKWNGGRVIRGKFGYNRVQTDDVGGIVTAPSYDTIRGNGFHEYKMSGEM